MPKDDGWVEHRIFVTKTLERLEQISSDHEQRDETRHLELLDRIAGIQSDLASLNVKASIWGLLGGAIPAIIVLVIMYLETHTK